MVSLMSIESTEVAALINLARRRGTDLSDVEIKAAGGGLPKSVRETVSAFSNGRGGVIILGLEEAAGFRPVDSFDAVTMRDALADACHDQLHPPVRADVEIVEVDGALVVVALVPELETHRKPCYVKVRGELGGSFIRGGDGDRRLTEYEIFLLHANAGQPREDVAPVTEASVDDLDADAIAGLLRRVRTRQPSAFRSVSDEVALQRLRVLVRHDDRLVPSLAGMLTLGSYPQQFFPQLNVTFVVIPATSKDTVPADGPRFLDNRTINGPIPVVVDDALNAVISNMSTRAIVRGAGREDVYDYPVEAVREAIVNALMHRDYSGWSHGTQVQVEMYSDRLVVRNPGGLYGTVTEDDLGEEGVSSSRNSYLAALLQDVTLPDSNRVVCENRGTGIPVMMANLRRAGLTPPEFDSRISRFTVTFPKHTLLDTDTVEWINSLGQKGLTDAQCLALALMRERYVTNAHLRQLGLDSRDATSALADLVRRGLAAKTGGRRYASYVLADAPSIDKPGPVRRPEAPTGTAARILALLASDGELTLAEIAGAASLGKAMTSRHLDQLMADGWVVASGRPRSRNRRYRPAPTRQPGRLG
jgi:ATP-dependent DNA helicase RecG